MAKFWLVSDQAAHATKHALVPPGPVTVGRATTCNIVIDNKQVSRNHASFVWVAGVGPGTGHWTVTDTGSSGGTFVNGVRVESGVTRRVGDRDTLALGPVMFQIIDEEAEDFEATLMGGGQNEQYEAVSAIPVEEFAQKKLALLFEASGVIHGSQDADTTRRALVQAVAQATEFENIAFVRSIEDGAGVEVLCRNDGADSEGLRISRSMLRRALSGTVKVSDALKSVDASIAASLENMSVRRAICIPVQCAGTHFGFLYMNDGTRSRLHAEERLNEAASMAEALARMAAQNLSNLNHTQEMVQLLVDASELNDEYTGGHSRRVAEFTRLLCEVAGLDAETTALAYDAGRVHDIGKIGVDRNVLRAPRKLTDEEFAQIARHPREGWRMLHKRPRMRDVLPGVLHHHEKWDGSGYPDRLAGNPSRCSAA